MGFFSSIGKALKGVGNFISKGVKAVTNAVGQVATVAAPIASVIPGFGIVAGAALSVAGQLLGPSPPDGGGGGGPTPATAAVQLTQVGGGSGGMGLALAAVAAYFLLR